MNDGDVRKEDGVEAATLEATLQGVPAGQAGLARLFQEHHARVLRAAWRITGNAADAEDVTQLVFLRVLRKDGAAALVAEGAGSYLHRAAVNAALDVVRSRRSARTTAIDEVGDGLAVDPRGAPDRRHADGEIREALRRALARLSPRAAEVFALRYLEGYDNHEIARMLGMPRMTVGVVLHRARARLRKDMDAFAGGRR
jgi:RNA polymerase sigma factor (sigma-70 family)